MLLVAIKAKGDILYCRHHDSARPCKSCNNMLLSSICLHHVLQCYIDVIFDIMSRPRGLHYWYMRQPQMNGLTLRTTPRPFDAWYRVVYPKWKGSHAYLGVQNGSSNDHLLTSYHDIYQPWELVAAHKAPRRQCLTV